MGLSYRVMGRLMLKADVVNICSGARDVQHACGEKRRSGIRLFILPFRRIIFSHLPLKRYVVSMIPCSHPLVASPVFSPSDLPLERCVVSMFPSFDRDVRGLVLIPSTQALRCICVSTLSRCRWGRLLSFLLYLCRSKTAVVRSWDCAVLRGTASSPRLSRPTMLSK